MAVLFWSSLGALLYIYFGYPALIWMISRFGKKRPSPKRPICRLPELPFWCLRSMKKGYPRKTR